MPRNTPERVSLQRNLALLFGISICRNLLFIVPVIVPYFADHIGLDFQAFLASEVVFAVTVAAMEVPSGWLADIWRRKSAIALGGGFMSAGLLTFLWADSFLTAAVGQVGMGVGISLMSGADSALLYDALQRHRQQRHFRRLEGRRHGLGLATVGLSAVVGGLMYEADPVWPVIATAVAVIGVVVCAMLIDEPERQPQVAVVPAGPVTTPTVFGPTTGVALIVLTGGILFASTNVSVWAQQAYFQAMALPASAFGLLMAVGSLCGGIAGWFGHHLDARIGAVRALAGLWLSLAVAFALAGASVGWSGVALLLLGWVAWGAGWPLLQTLLNRRVAARRRATVLSTASLAIRFGFIPLSTLVGWLSDHYGIGMGLTALSVWLLVGGGLVWLITRLNGPQPAPLAS